jgi:hypothetical protein
MAGKVSAFVGKREEIGTTFHPHERQDGPIRVRLIRRRVRGRCPLQRTPRLNLVNSRDLFIWWMFFWSVTFLGLKLSFTA